MSEEGRGELRGCWFEKLISIATASKCGDVTGFGTCMAVPGCRKIDKMSMERVYGGHIMVHHPWGKWLLGWCAYAGTL